MSLIEMQKAMSLLIRLPEHNRNEPDLEAFLAKFFLSEREIFQIRELALDPNVVKYGRSMSGVRWTIMSPRFGLINRLVPEETMDYLRRYVFEPQAVKVPNPLLAIRFLEFLLEHPKAIAALESSSPRYIFDVVRFELGQARFYSRMGKNDSVLPKGSRLKHARFEILDLSFDIPDWLVEIDSSEESFQMGPKGRPTKVLLVPSLSGPGCRYFEIDEEVSSFLKSQARAGAESTRLPSEDTYQVLVHIGLCVPQPFLDDSSKETL